MTGGCWTWRAPSAAPSATMSAASAAVTARQKAPMAFREWKALTISLGAGTHRRRADSELLDLPGLHVVDVALGQHEIGFLPGLIEPRVVVHGDLPLPHDFEPVAGDDDRGALGQADAE